MSETGNVSYLIENRIIFTPATQCLARVDHPFYQSILSLRKSLLQLELEQPLLTTLPRKGLIIQEEFDIQVIETPEENSASAEESLAPDATIEEFLADTPRQPLITAAETVMLALTLIICVLILYPWQASDDYFSGYITADKAPTDCQYYFNNDASHFSRHTAFIDKNPGLCQSHKFIYITTYPESKKLSVLVCRSPIKARQENACQSVYYPRYDS